MSRYILYTSIVTLALGFTSKAEIRVTDHAEISKKQIQIPITKKNKSQKTQKIKSKTNREPAAAATAYVLESRDTGQVVTFHESTVSEVIQNMRAVDLPVEKWHSCSQKPTQPSAEFSLEDLETKLDMTLLIESLANGPAPELTDAQKDWVARLSPCADDMRLHLKALSLILSNYKLIKKPDA